MPILHTARLDLIPLSSAQLALYLEQPTQLEQQLGLPLSRSIVTGPVPRAIRMKLEKMDQLDPMRHLWVTYWLLVIRSIPFGAGLAGFKGVPDQKGEVEIGYGIDPEFQNQGYVTEAVRKLIAWAFEEEECLTVTARGIRKGNVASRRVAEKVGMRLSSVSEESLSYKLGRGRVT